MPTVCTPRPRVGRLLRKSIGPVGPTREVFEKTSAPHAAVSRLGRVPNGPRAPTAFSDTDIRAGNEFHAPTPSSRAPLLNAKSRADPDREVLWANGGCLSAVLVVWKAFESHSGTVAWTTPQSSPHDVELNAAWDSLNQVLDRRVRVS